MALKTFGKLTELAISIDIAFLNQAFLPTCLVNDAISYSRKGSIAIAKHLIPPSDTPFNASYR